MLKEYKNESYADFSLPENNAGMQTALRLVDSQKGAFYPLVIGGERITTPQRIKSVNPSLKGEIIAWSASAEIEHAELAVQSAQKAFLPWSATSSRQRVGYLLKAAGMMKKRKFEFNSWLVEEAGKNWQEAEADTAEAIDFMQYYAQLMLHVDRGMPVQACPGETNECFYIPLGVGLIIAPWNFPLAILVGMTAAAIVAGNTVVIKPASATVAIAAKFVELLEQAGLPDGVVNFLPGSGTVIGDYLVRHPGVRFINFTGSKDVGIRIAGLAAEVSPGQKWIKRASLEMGGKNAIIVDAEADLEDAAAGIVASAFGFQGQKCSACSRAIIDKTVYNEILSIIEYKVRQLNVGSARQFGVNMGPVIDAGAYQKIMHYIDIGKTEGRLICGGEGSSNEGFFIQPTVFADVLPAARIANDEIFGPVLALIKAQNFEDALCIANSTEYGLTGGVYSRNRAKLERARSEFHVGNLYFNRKCTGALVGVQPFGGFNMSGTDSKAGGADYLLLFMQAKSVTERL